MNFAKLHEKKFWIDVVLIALFFTIAVIVFLGRWSGIKPYTELWTDAGVVSSFSAALDFPEHFTNDALLSDARRPKGYLAMHVPLLRLLTKVTGDYGYSFCLLIIPVLFLHLTGYYLLANYLFRNRIMAISFSAINLVTIYYGVRDYWGFFIDPQPRLLFQAILPFLLLFALWGLDKPKWWIAIMAGCGILFYFHALSGIAIGLMIWFGLMFSPLPNISRKKHLLYIVLSGIAFLVFFVPLIDFYFTNVTSISLNSTSEQPLIPYDIAYPYFFAIFNDLLNINTVFTGFISQMTSYLLLPLGLIGMIGTLYLASDDDKKRAKFISYWFAAIILISIIIPWIEHFIESKLQILPIQIDSARNLRYTIPIFYIFIFWFIRLVLTKHFSSKKIFHATVAVIGLLLVCGFAWNANRLAPQYGYVYENVFINEINCLKKGQLFCPTPYEQESRRVIKYIRDELPQESVFISVPDYRLSDAIRYGGLKSVALSNGDVSRTIFLDMQKSMELGEVSKKWNKILTYDSAIDQLDGFVSLACENNASHILIDSSYQDSDVKNNQHLKILFETNTFMVTEILSCE